jgi:predicted NAD/FAD-dependent oxidoreductase
MNDADVLILGAGMAGLMAALALPRGTRAALLEAGHSPGGRLATRRLGAGVADSGAQFFTARVPAFETWVQQWVRSGLAFRWADGWSSGWREGSRDAGGFVIPAGGHPRYAVHGGMVALAQELAAQAQAQGAALRTRTKVVALHAEEQGWRAVADDGRSWRAARAVVTCPAPQALALFDAGDTPLAEADRIALEMIEYAPGLCGLFVVEGEVRLPPPGAAQRLGAPVPWIADNRRKGISPQATVVTVQAGPELSRRDYNRPDASVLATLRAALDPFLSPGARVTEADLERWRYSLPEVGHPARTLRAAGLPPLFFAGDAFGSPRVEGAALSGMEAGRAVFSDQ